jgi:diphthine methyl ester synthase
LKVIKFGTPPVPRQTTAAPFNCSAVPGRGQVWSHRTAEMAPSSAPSTAADAPSGPSKLPQAPGLYLVGLGLGDERDITLRGLDVVRAASAVYLEAYTSVLAAPVADLEALYGVPVTVADREAVEERADEILAAAARPGGAAFLVVGDPFGATTHSDLWLRARELDLPITSVHNASVMNAVAACGLQLYRFGEAVSLCFWTDSWTPHSYYSKIVANRRAGLHTLCLLDIKVKEPSAESLARGKKEYEPARFMTIAQAIEQLLVCEGRVGGGVCKPDSLAVGIARLGQPDQLFAAGTMADLLEYEFGKPLHSLVIPAEELHFHERAVLNCFSVGK